MAETVFETLDDLRAAVGGTVEVEGQDEPACVVDALSRRFR